MGSRADGTRRGLVAGLVTALVALGFLGWWSIADRPAHESKRDLTPAEGCNEATATETERTTTTRPSSGPHRAEVESTADPRAPGTGLRIVVLDQRRAPAPGAKVWCSPRSTFATATVRSRQELLQGQLDPMLDLRDREDFATTDVQGVAICDYSHGDLLIVAESGGEFGMRGVDSSYLRNLGYRLEVEIARPIGLTAEVVGAKGPQIGGAFLSVDLDIRRDGQDFPGLYTQGWPTLPRAGGMHGPLQVFDLGYFLGVQSDDLVTGAAIRSRLLGSEDGPEVSIDLQPGDNLVNVPADDSGELRVRLHGRSGMPPSGSSWVKFSWMVPSDEGDQTRSMHLESREGEVSAPILPGSTVTVSAIGFEPQVVVGPDSAGGSVLCELGPATDSVEIVGIAVDESGDALAQQRLRFCIRPRGDRSIVTDTEGHFQTLVSSTWLAEVGWFAYVDLSHSDLFAVDARAELPELRPEGPVIDLGTLRFRRTLLASGRVVGGAANRWDGISVSVFDDSTEEWQYVGSALERNGSEFSLFGPPIAGRLKLDLWSFMGTPVCDSIETIVGKKGLVIDTGAGASVEVNLELLPDAGDGDDAPPVALVPKEGKPRWNELAWSRQLESGERVTTHRWNWAPAGTYRLAARMPGCPGPAVIEENFVVDAEPVSWSGTLRGRLDVIELTLLDVGGDPIDVDYVNLWVRDLSTKLSNESFKEPWRGGGEFIYQNPARLFVDRPVWVRIDARGYERVEIDSVFSSRTIVMRKRGG